MFQQAPLFKTKEPAKELQVREEGEESLSSIEKCEGKGLENERKRTATFTRRHWTRTEDEAISELINKHGIKKWSLIAKKLREDFGVPGRSGKQCRERWRNYLDPMLSRSQITPEEEQKIFLGQRKYGNKWSEISKLLPGRRDNVIKNHFYSTLRRQLRSALKNANADTLKCPNNVNVRCIWETLRKNSVPYTLVDNENVRALLNYIDKKPEEIHILSEDSDNSTPNKVHFDLYLFIIFRTPPKRKLTKEDTIKEETCRPILRTTENTLKNTTPNVLYYIK